MFDMNDPQSVKNMVNFKLYKEKIQREIDIENYESEEENFSDESKSSQNQHKGQEDAEKNEYIRMAQMYKQSQALQKKGQIDILKIM